MGPRRRWRVALAVPALGLLAGACSGTRVDERNAAGRLEVGDLVQADLADVECAEPGGTLFAAGVAVGDDGELTVVDLEVTEGEVLATVRTSRGDDVVGQQVGQDLTATRDGDQLEVAGTFVVYDGAVQSGEVAGEVTLTCEPDTDPGGGFLVVDGTEVPYDLVTCVETDESFEARGAPPPTPPRRWRSGGSCSAAAGWTASTWPATSRWAPTPPPRTRRRRRSTWPAACSPSAATGSPPRATCSATAAWGRWS